MARRKVTRSGRNTRAKKSKSSARESFIAKSNKPSKSKTSSKQSGTSVHGGKQYTGGASSSKKSMAWKGGQSSQRPPGLFGSETAKEIQSFADRYKKEMIVVKIWA